MLCGCQVLSTGYFVWQMWLSWHTVLGNVDAATVGFALRTAEVLYGIQRRMSLALLSHQSPCTEVSQLGSFCSYFYIDLYCITWGLIKRIKDVSVQLFLFLPFRSGRKWPGIYSSHNGQRKGRLHWQRSADPWRWWWGYSVWDSQTEAKDGYYGRDILWQMTGHFSVVQSACFSIKYHYQTLICMRR